MLAKIVYILGIVAAIWCVLDIFKKKNLDLIIRILIAAAVLLTSWVGIVIYYFIVKDKI